MKDFLFNFLDWDRDFYAFNRPTKDMYPYEIVRKDNKCTIVFNIVGISKENISVSFDKARTIDYLVISGENKNEITGKNYSVNARFVIDSNEVKEIEWYVQDGLLYVNILYRIPEKPKIEIKCIK